MELSKEQVETIKSIDGRIERLKKTESRINDALITCSFDMLVQSQSINYQMVSEGDRQRKEYQSSLRKSLVIDLAKIASIILAISVLGGLGVSGFFALATDATVASTFASTFLSAFVVALFASSPKIFYRVKDYKEALKEPIIGEASPSLCYEIDHLDKLAAIKECLVSDRIRIANAIKELEEKREELKNYLITYFKEYGKDYGTRYTKYYNLDGSNQELSFNLGKKNYEELGTFEYEQTSLFPDITEVPGQMSLFDENKSRVREIK